nr:hypothetical protein [Tanacetum cinerariifolium]
MAAYKSKSAKMMKQYNHCITFIYDHLPITKFSYMVNKSTKEATMMITRNNQRLNLKWVATQAGKLGIPPTPKLTTFELPSVSKKRKRMVEIIKDVFFKDGIVVDGMHRNLVPSEGVVGLNAEH